MQSVYLCEESTSVDIHVVFKRFAFENKMNYISPHNGRICRVFYHGGSGVLCACQFLLIGVGHLKRNLGRVLR